MRWLWVGAALALAGCGSEPGGGDGERAGFRPMNLPYSGYPGPVGPVGDEGSPGKLGFAPKPPVDASRTGTSDAGAVILSPPSTAMPGPRPLYPPDAGAALPGRPRRGG